jgi:hypothetical protein
MRRSMTHIPGLTSSHVFLAGAESSRAGCRVWAGEPIAKRRLSVGYVATLSVFLAEAAPVKSLLPE